MNSNNLPFNPRSTTTKDAHSGPFKGTPNPAAIYRSLEVPLPQTIPSPLLFRSSLSDSKSGFPALKNPQTKSPGLVTWDSIQTEVVPPCVGIFVPSTTSFVLSTSMSFTDCVESIHRTLAKRGADVESFSGFEWTCSSFDNFVETTFSVRLFNSHLVDFQRESGCAFAFNSLFISIKSDLTGQTGAPFARKAFKCLALPTEMKESMEEEEQGVKSLMDMCASPCLDVQREGLRTVATSSLSPAISSSAETCGRLGDILASSKDVQVRRLVASSLSNLTSDPAVANRMQVGEEVLRALVSLVVDEREHAETRRQAGRAVLNLSRTPAFAPLVRSSALPISNFSCKDSQLSEIVGSLQGFLAVGV